MTTSQNANPASGSLDEIDQIMAEIESLQQNMATAQAQPPVAQGAAPVAQGAAPVAQAAAPVAQAAAPVAQAAAPAADAAPAPVAEPAPTAAAGESSPVDDLMAEFQAGKGEAPMEETLAELKDEAPAAPGLIDQVIEAPVASAEPVTQTLDASVAEFGEGEDSELLDAAETEALDSAIVEEELRMLKEFDEMVEEAPPVAAAPKSAPTPRLVGVPATPVAQATAPAPAAPVAQVPRPGAPSPTSGEAGSVALALSGNMALKLSYEFEGQQVTIRFVDGALRVELSDGTEFKIPVRRNSLRKAV